MDARLWVVRMKRLLMVAYHFPPLAGSSGIQRTLRFVQHLPKYGWEPIVLAAHPRAYERTSEDLMSEIPEGVMVRRAFAFDAARHFSFRGRFFDWTACPDRWMSWRFDAILQGMRLVRQFRPDAIWSTYPIPTAHVIGAALHRRSGLPWIADFRDPMAQDGYPADPKVWRSFKRIEKMAAEEARWCVFTTPGAQGIYQARYPESAGRMALVENGFDEESFPDLAAIPGELGVRRQGQLVLLHSGIVYPNERDPTQLFRALRLLRHAGRLAPGDLRIRFRAAVHDGHLQALATREDVADFVEFCPPIPYRSALEEMLRADGLLVLQAANCNQQIPAKLYEYLRAGRPILGLTDPSGDTAGVLLACGLSHVARLESDTEIADTLSAFVVALRAGQAPTPDAPVVARASRSARAAELALLLDRI